MRAIDTNILVRFLVSDDDKQAKKVLRLFETTEADNEILFVPQLVQIELIWVLDSAYSCTRQEIVDSVSDLMQMPILKFESQSALQSFANEAIDSNYDLADLLICHSAKISGCKETLTFDKKASKHELFRLLK